jgi:hypothetical protein
MKSEYPSCSEECFYSSLEGSYFKREMTKARDEKRIGLPVPYDPTRLVHTFWDIGMDDENCIWFPLDRRRAPPPDRFLIQLRRIMLEVNSSKSCQSQLTPNLEEAPGWGRGSKSEIDPSATSAAHCGSSSDAGSALSMYSF